MKIIPLEGYLLIEPLKPEDKTESGIFLSEDKHSEMLTGKVLSVSKVSSLKEGLEIFYKKRAVTELSIKGAKCYLLQEEGVLAYKK